MNRYSAFMQAFGHLFLQMMAKRCFFKDYVSKRQYFVISKIAKTAFLGIKSKKYQLFHTKICI